MSLWTRKILIIADLEGIIGVEDIFSEDAKLLMAEELNLIVNCLRQQEKNCEITICNVHNDGQLLSCDDIKAESINLLMGITSLSECEWNFDYAVMVGLHGKRNSGGTFDHTFRGDFLRMWRTDDDYHIGEVFSFKSWIESKSIPVILVSGEGSFEDEILNYPCQIHRVVRSLSTDEQYVTLSEAIEKSQCYVQSLTSFDDSKKVFIQLDNSDKIMYLADEGFVTEDDTVVFNSFEHFFIEIYRLARVLNSSSEKIVKLNYEFAKSIRVLNVQENGFPELDNIFAKPLELINKSDRDTIIRSLKI